MVGSRALRNYRKERGLTQAALGKELGVTPVTIGRWENGKRSPRKREVPSLVEKTGLSPAEILGLEDVEAAQ